MRKYKNTSHKQKFSSGKSSSPTRNISGGIKFRVLFHGVMVTIGVAFALIGLTVFVPFAMMVDFSDLKFSKNSPIVQGEVVNITGTNSYSNDVRVYEYQYEYFVNGKRYTGESYRPGNYEIPNPEIQYLKDSPEISRIVGMNNGSFTVWILLFLLIFPVVGILLSYFGIKKNLNYIRILEVGKVTFGTFLRMQSTGSSVNNQQVYRMFFNFIAENGRQYEATGETHLIHKLQDEQFEPLIYNPFDPTQAVMIDSLPNSVRKILIEDIERARRS